MYYCLMDLKPTRIAKKSKKIYKDIFIRKKGSFHHLYELDGLYIVSVPLAVEPKDWIDRNYEEIQKRDWMKGD